MDGMLNPDCDPLLFFAASVSSVAAGDVFNLTIMAKDSWGNVLDEPSMQLQPSDILEARLVDSSDGTAISFRPQYDPSSSNFTETFTMTRAGTYSIQGLLRGRPTLVTATSISTAVNSPQLVVNPAVPSAGNVAFYGPALLGGTVGTNYSLTVRLRDRFGNKSPLSSADAASSTNCYAELTNMTNSGCSNVTFACAVPSGETSSSDLAVSVYTECAASYYLRVFVGGTEVTGSPFANVTFATGLANATLSTLSPTLASEDPLVALRNSPAQINVTARDSFGNLIDLGSLAFEGYVNDTVTGNTVSTVSFAYAGSGLYVGTYRVTAVSDKLSLVVQINGDIVGGSARSLNVSASPTDPAQSYVVPSTGTSVAIAGANTTFTVVAVDSSGARQDGSVVDDVTVDTVPSGDANYPVVVSVAKVSGQPVYTVTYMVEKLMYNADNSSKPYEFTVKINGTAIGNGAALSIYAKAGPVNGTLSEVQDVDGTPIIISPSQNLNINGSAGNSRLLLVQTKDEYGNNGYYDSFGPHVNVTAVIQWAVGYSGQTSTLPSNYLAAVVTAIDLQDGRQRLDLTMYTAGYYYLTVYVNGNVTYNSVGNGILVQCTPGDKSFANYVVTGPAVTASNQLVSGVMTGIIITPSDAYNNSILTDSSALLTPLPLTETIYTFSGTVLQGATRTAATLNSSISTSDATYGINLLVTSAGPCPGSLSSLTCSAGQWVVQFTPAGTGQLVLYIRVAGGSSAVVTGGPILGATVVAGSLNSLSIGGPTATAVFLNGSSLFLDYTITPLDSNGNTVTGLSASSLTVTHSATYSTSCASAATATYTVTAQSSGALRVTSTFSPTASCASTLTAVTPTFALGGKSAQATTAVYALGSYSPTPSSTVMSGYGYLRAQVGVATSFHVQLGTAISQTVTAPWPKTVGSGSVFLYIGGQRADTATNILGYSFRDNFDGTYDVSFTPKVSGLLNLTLFVGSFPSSAYSGLLLVISGPVASIQSSVLTIGGAPFPSSTVQAYSGLDLTVKVTPLDAYGNPVDFIASSNPAIDFSPPALSGAASVVIKDTTAGTVLYQPTSFTAYNTSYTATTLIQSPLSGYVQTWAFTVVLNPVTRGIFALSVQGGSAAATVYTLSVLAGLPSKSKSQISGLGASRTVAGVAGTFSVILRDDSNNGLGNAFQQISLMQSLGYDLTYFVGGQVITGNLVGATGTTCPITFTYNSVSSAYDATYTCNSAGIYNLVLRVIGQYFMPYGVPGQVTVVPGGLSLVASTIYGPGAGSYGTLVADTPASFKVYAVDAAGNRLTSGGAIITATLGTGETRSSPAVQDNSDGTYTVTLTPTAAGNKTLVVERDGLQLSASGFNITVIAGSTDPSQATISTAQGLGSFSPSWVYSGAAGITLLVAVTPADTAGNQVLFTRDIYTYQLISASGTEFTGFFVPTASTGTMGPYVTLSGLTLAQPLYFTYFARGKAVGPMVYTVVPADYSPATTVVIAPGSPTSSVYSEGMYPETIFLVSRDAYGNRIRNAVDIPNANPLLAQYITFYVQISGTAITSNPTVINNGDGSYKSSFTVTKATGVNIFARVCYQVHSICHSKW